MKDGIKKAPSRLRNFGGLTKTKFEYKNMDISVRKQAFLTLMEIYFCYQIPAFELNQKNQFNFLLIWIRIFRKGGVYEF